MADHPLKSAIDRSLGGAVTSPTKSIAGSSEGDNIFYSDTSGISYSFPQLFEPSGRFPHVTHPCATKSEDYKFDLHV